MHSIILELVIVEERMRKWQIYMVPRRNVITIWMKWVEIFCMYTEIDSIIGHEQSRVDVRNCDIRSRGRHFSPSLPGRGPTGIWNLAHSISDPRSEILRILVMVRRSSTTSRGTTYLVCACAMFLTWCAYQNQEKQRQLAMKEGISSIPDPNLQGFQHGSGDGLKSSTTVCVRRGWANFNVKT